MLKGFSPSEIKVFQSRSIDYKMFIRHQLDFNCIVLLHHEKLDNIVNGLKRCVSLDQ